MRILLGMCVMAHRTGAELFVRDLALSLNRKGHAVVVYAPVMGEMVEELRFNSIACVTDLDSVAVAPDIIIGNTQIETVMCLAHFPGVPAISICHDRFAPHGEPPKFTRVRAYVAVDANCEERLVLECGILPARVSIIQNGVDLRRFRPRPPLPERPKRAAIFSNYATYNAETEWVRQACAEEGIELHVIGSGSGSQAKAPEDVLVDYDLVFAKARCAMEAMAVGCAVIVLNEGFGMAGMVSSENVADWHRWNFGRKLLLQHPIQLERLRQAIRSYSADDAARVSAYMRSQGSLDATAEAFECLADAVVRGEEGLGKVAPEAENGEFARFVHEFMRPPGPDQVAVQVGMLRQQLDQFAHDQSICQQEAARLQQQLGQSAHDQSVFQQESAHLRQQIEAVYASGSWRLTAPLRWLLGRIVNLRQRRRYHEV